MLAASRTRERRVNPSTYILRSFYSFEASSLSLSLKSIEERVTKHGSMLKAVRSMNILCWLSYLNRESDPSKALRMKEA